MAAFTDIDDLINKMTGGASGTPETVFFNKYMVLAGAGSPDANLGVGFFGSMWQFQGTPGPGATPTTVAAPTSATVGAIPFTNPGGGREKFIVTCGMAYGEEIGIMVYDRLLHIGGLDATLTSAQTVGGTLTRNTGGVGNQIWLEIYTSPSVTARNLTASYTNQAGTSGRTTQVADAFGVNSNAVGSLHPLQLQAGDTGVRSVQSVTQTEANATAGNYGVTIARPLMMVQGMHEHPGILGRNMPEVEADACLALAYYSSQTTTMMTGAISMVES